MESSVRRSTATSLARKSGSSPRAMRCLGSGRISRLPGAVVFVLRTRADRPFLRSLHRTRRRPAADDVAASMVALRAKPSSQSVAHRLRMGAGRLQLRVDDLDTVAIDPRDAAHRDHRRRRDPESFHAAQLRRIAAMSAFVLCRRITHSFWPSMLGGFVFGFSSYMMGQTLDHLPDSSSSRFRSRRIWSCDGSKGVSANAGSSF